MNPLVHLNYPLNIELLLQQASEARLLSKPYTDNRYPEMQLNDWHIGHYTSEYIEQIMRDFGINGKPRFYWLEPFAEIPEHVDNGTLCSLNFILSPDPAPIVIEDVEYIYKSVLLNTALRHSVTNNENERVMLKISIFDESFEDLAKRIPYAS
jgi:hypothetical protein